jgi:enamine deaminase RidA (YjgF/YER057c/UK114 family)
MNGGWNVSRQFINPPDAGPTHGRYSKAVKVGNRVFVAGQVPVDMGGHVSGPGDMDVQISQTLRNFGRVLEECGASFADTAMTRVYPTSVAYRSPLGEARRAAGLAGSTSTLAVVESLTNPALLLEISGIASIGGERETFSPDTVHQTPGTYTHGVQVDDTLYIAGQIALDPEGNLVGPGDAEAQADQAALNLLRVLEAAGGSPDDIVYTCLYLTNPGYIPAIRAARQKYGLNGCPSTLVVIPSLATADFLVEIEAIAVMGTNKTIITPSDVHSVSGRYEHAIVAGDTVYLAGQIALDADGALVGRGDAEAQSRQLYANMERVLAAAGASFDDLVSTTVYLTNLQHREAHNKVRGELGITAPANTSVVISALAQPEFLLEVEGIAVTGN